MSYFVRQWQGFDLLQKNSGPVQIPMPLLIEKLNKYGILGIGDRY
jgi:hypothetical protein